MLNAHSISYRIRERKSVVNVDINAEIKHLQRKLVLFSFDKESHTSEYFKVLERIKELRRKIFDKVRN